MRQKSNLLRALAGALILTTIGCATSATQTPPSAVPASPDPVVAQTPQGPWVRQVPRRATGALTDVEMSLARTAWKYFENNYQPATGFVNAVDNYPSSTMWDLASAFAGSCTFAAARVPQPGGLF